PDPLHSSAIPTDPQSWNRYSYVGNRPTILIDPVGLAWGYFSGNGGSWYQWFDDEKDIKKNGGTVVKSNGPPGAFTYESTDGRWIRLDLSKNSWQAFSHSEDAWNGFELDRSESNSGLGQAVELTLNITGGNIATRICKSALGRILGSEITTLGLSGGTAVASSGTDIAEMTFVRAISHGESLGNITNELKQLTFSTGNEHALVKLASGERAIVSGGSDGINFGGQITRLYAHTHPYQALATGASEIDRIAIQSLGQRSSFLLERGNIIKFTQSSQEIIKRFKF